MKISAFFISILLASAAYTETQALSELIYQIRDPKTDAPHFRESLKSIGRCMAYQVLEHLPTKTSSIETLTGEIATHSVLAENPVLVTILRAGLPLNDGVSEVFPHAEIGFLGTARNEETLEAETTYVALPNLKDRYVILSDTMLGTGGSLINAIEILNKHGPKKIFVICAIASKEGVKNVLDAYPSASLFPAAVDPVLNEQGYIIPGLGDAGDRAYGRKQG